jgi:hypothetical protein
MRNMHLLVCFLVVGLPRGMTILWNFMDIISLFVSICIAGNRVLSCDIRLLFEVLMLCLRPISFSLSGRGSLFSGVFY